MSPLKIIALLLLLCCGPAQADVAGARVAQRKGEWKTAEDGFRQAVGAERGPALIGLAEVQSATGRYAEALATAGQAAAVPATQGAALCLTGEIQRDTGHLPEAARAFRAAIAANPRDLRARVLLGLTLLDTGDTTGGKITLSAVMQEVRAGRPDQKEAAPLLYAGMAATGLGAVQDANRLFQQAVEKDPTWALAHCEWGDLFLRKYRPDEAAKSYADALKINSHDQRALIGRARALVEGPYEVKAARALADQALKENPKYVPALALHARLALDDEEFAAAETLLREAVSINPAHLETRALLGASRYLQEDTPGYEAQKQAVLKGNPRASGFFFLVGELAIRQHRYAEAAALNREALALNPGDADALAALGMTLLRLAPGNDAEALKVLQQAFDADNFNARTFNLLRLYEDVLPKSYDSLTVGPFFYRFPKAERPLLERYVPPAIQRAWDRYVEKYKFTPKTPVAIELYAQRQHYGARTTGMPEIGAQGTCFGQLVTAMSPAAAEASWELVLAHELAHVFHLQLSRNRAPRWFTEGLAEYETNVARPHWKREHARELYTTLRKGELWKLSELSGAFTHPDRANGVLLAYYQSSLAIHYLAETCGFPKLVEALRLYGQGKRDSDVLPWISGKTTAQLDTGFREFLERRFAPLARGFYFEIAEFSARDKLESAAKGNPNDPLARARFAAALLPRDPEAAAAEARKALALDEVHSLARFVLGAALERQKDAKGAAVEYERLLAEGVDGRPIRLALARIAVALGDTAGAIRHLEAARPFDPEDSEPLAGLMDLYEKANNRDALLKTAEAYLDIQEHEHETARLLVDRLALDGRWADLVRVAPRVLEITPSEGFVHQQYGRALAALKQPKQAAFELESALLAGLRRPVPTRALMARQWLLAGDKARARAAAEQVLKEEPGNAEARDVLKAAQ